MNRNFTSGIYIPKSCFAKSVRALTFLSLFCILIQVLPKEAYAQIKKDLQYQKKIKKKKKINGDEEKDTLKDFKKEFAKLTRHH